MPRLLLVVAVVSLPTVAPTAPAATASEPAAPAPTTPAVTSPRLPPGPLVCQRVCFSDAAVAVPFYGGDRGAVAASSQDACREFCAAVPDCEAFVYATHFANGSNNCWGQRDVRINLCEAADGYVTEMLSVMPNGTCMLLGEPHIFSFDDPSGNSGRNLQLATGDYWLVQHELLQIQGRFGYSAAFPAATSTVGVAIAGALIKGHKLTAHYVGPERGRRGFKVFWDGLEILGGGGIPASYQSADEILRASLANVDARDFHAEARRAIDGVHGGMPSFVFDLVPNIRVYMLLADETANIVITLKRPYGFVDGYCGNFNCISEDDTFADLLARGVAEAIEGGSLFDGAPPSPPSQMMPFGVGPTDVGDCDPSLLARAKEACEKSVPAVRDACIFDVCAAGVAGFAREDVAREDIVAGAVATEMEQHFELLGVPLPAWFGARLPTRIPSGFAVLLLSLASFGAALGWKTRRGSARGFGFVPVVTHEDAEDDEHLLVASEHDDLGACC